MKYFILRSFTFFFLFTNFAFSQFVTESIEGLYMISELPLPKSEIPYEVQVYEKILDDGSFENLNFSEYKIL